MRSDATECGPCSILIRTPRNWDIMRVLIMAARTRRLTDAAPSGTWVSESSAALDRRGRLRVSETIVALACAEPTLLITDRDLTTPESRQLFGFTDYRRGVAIVSVFRLDDGSDSLARRLENVISHERGHLAGLRHCANPHCLMNPASAATDLDSRSEAPCGHCPRRGFLAATARWPGQILCRFGLRSGAIVRR